jgi:O-antigen/teichoic acid export membrane protein
VNPDLQGLLKAGALLVFFNVLFGVQSAALAGFEEFRALARTSLVTGLLGFPATVGGAYYFGLHGAVWGAMLGSCLSVLLTFAALLTAARKFGISLRAKSPLREFRVLRDFSFPALMSSAMIIPINWVGMGLLARQPGGYSEIAAYSAADQWFAALLFLPNVVVTSVMPILSERIAAAQIPQARKLMFVAIKTNAIVVIPIAIVASVASPWLMSLYGSEFRLAWPVMVISLWAAVMAAIQWPMGVAVTASGRMWAWCLLHLSWALVFLGSAYFLVAFGGVGLAAAKCMAYACYALLTFRYSKYMFSIR